MEPICYLACISLHSLYCQNLSINYWMEAIWPESSNPYEYVYIEIMNNLIDFSVRINGVVYHAPQVNLLAVNRLIRVSCHIPQVTLLASSFCLMRERTSSSAMWWVSHCITHRVCLSLDIYTYIPLVLVLPLRNCLHFQVISDFIHAKLTIQTINMVAQISEWLYSSQHIIIKVYLIIFWTCAVSIFDKSNLSY